ncbi:probable E3 ubiquitin-protein ligase BAH1-like 1 [Miscanthus floridulus]|uniref:probable E3 ubiquitin-protein ligase BAH1-like 1 n=1 Tax=Miscanthus floridulus TaxID=154761 RepID=UPI00345A6894
MSSSQSPEPCTTGTPSPVLSVRIVSLDYYMAPPLPGFGFSRSPFHGEEVEEVPVVRIYGSTPAGQKACLHIHRDTLFNPYALSCGHLFCKACACGAASVYIFQGVKSAPPEAKCPVCRAVGVFGRAVHMTELELLLKRRDKDYFPQRLR